VGRRSGLSGRRSGLGSRRGSIAGTNSRLSRRDSMGGRRSGLGSRIGSRQSGSIPNTSDLELQKLATTDLDPIT